MGLPKLFRNARENTGQKQDRQVDGLSYSVRRLTRAVADLEHRLELAERKLKNEAVRESRLKHAEQPPKSRFVGLRAGSPVPAEMRNHG